MNPGTADDASTAVPTSASSTSRPNTTRRPSPIRTAHTQSGSSGQRAPSKSSRMRAPMGSVLIVPGGSSPARALPGLGGQGGRRLAASIGGEAGRGTRPRGRRGSSVRPVSRLAISLPSADRGRSRAWANWSAGERPARSTAPITAPAEVPTISSAERASHPVASARAASTPVWNAPPTTPPAPSARPTAMVAMLAPADVGGQNGWWWAKCARAASSIGRPVAKMPVPPNKDASLPEHPDLAAEQAYIVHAYDCLDEARVSASRLESMVEVSPRGGTNQARFERDVIWDTILARLRELDIGDASLVFGRIDHEADDAAPSDNGTYYIGRIAVADQNQEPVVIDWRAPVAEPFYRATGRLPMGLSRRRHFATRGRTLLGIEDELFGEAAERLGIRRPASRPKG